MKRKEREITFRYEEIDACFSLTNYMPFGMVKDVFFNRPLEERPTWVKPIVDMGLVGGFTLTYNSMSHQGFVLWFDVTPVRKKLLRFHDYSGNHENVFTSY